MQDDVFIGIGSNLGDRLENIKQAIIELAKICVVQNIAGIYESEPWGKVDQPQFLNTVIRVSTTLKPRDMLHELKRIETKLGRVPAAKWDPRSIDLDILFWGHEKVDLPRLTIPHPYWKERDFVVIPMKEIAPHFVPPDSKKPIRQAAFDFLESRIKQIAPKLK